MIIFRNIPITSLGNAAKEKMIQARNHRVTDNQTLLVPHVDGSWGSKKRVDKYRVTYAMAGVQDRPSGTQRDRILMDKFLANTVKDTVTIPKVTKFSDIIPNEIPIIDFLQAYKNNTVTWDIPSAGSVDV